MKQAHNKNKKLIEQVCAILQSQRYAERTQQTYIDWIQRFLQFHSKCAPKNLTEADVKVFLSHLDFESMLLHRLKIKLLAQFSFYSVMF